MTAEPIRADGDGDVPIRIRIAALLFIGDAGFGLTMPFALAHLARTGELPMTSFGFRAFSGPFERLGPGPFTALGWALVGVCAAEVVAGIWLWRGQRRGAMLGLATTPLALALGGGFALPFLLIPAPIRAGLVLATRRRLCQARVTSVRRGSTYHQRSVRRASGEVWRTGRWFDVDRFLPPLHPCS